MTDAAPYAIVPARYAKGKMIVQCPSPNGFKTRAAYLIEALGGRYVQRSHGYTVSPAGAAKFEQMYAAGWDATMLGVLLPPRALA